MISKTQLLANLQEYKREYFQWLDSVDFTKVIEVVDLVVSRASEQKNVFICGNGGSASLSQHFAVDLGVGTEKLASLNGVKAFDLTSNAAIVTATANDKSYSDIFAEQVKLYGSSGDILIAISSSGNSENLIKAVNYAIDKKLTTIGITGFDGGTLRNIVDYSIHVESRKGEYGRVEDAHSFILHLITDLFRKIYVDK